MHRRSHRYPFASFFLVGLRAALALCLTNLLYSCEQVDLLERNDSDGDTVADFEDAYPDDPKRCYDKDKDGCDDCTNGSPDAQNDGEDFDKDLPGADGVCDFNDPDDDNDHRHDDVDPDDHNPNVCGGTEDNCDDCIRHKGVPSPLDDGPDLNTDSVCDVDDPKTPALTICVAESRFSQSIAPFLTATAVADKRHDQAAIAAWGIPTFSGECAAAHASALNDVNASLIGGCRNNAAVSWNVATFFFVIAQDGTALPQHTATFNNGDNCPLGTLFTVDSTNCLDTPSPGGYPGCKTAGGGSGPTLQIYLDPVTHGGLPHAGNPKETFPFVTYISFKANDYTESTKKNSAKLLVQYKKADGAVVNLFDGDVYNTAETAQANPYVIAIPAGGEFLSGSASLTFTRVGGPIVLRDIRVTGRKN